MFLDWGDTLNLNSRRYQISLFFLRLKIRLPTVSLIQRMGLKNVVELVRTCLLAAVINLYQEAAGV